jgi:hypothetical protein
MEPRSETRRNIKPRCIINYTTSSRSAIRPLEMKVAVRIENLGHVVRSNESFDSEWSARSAGRQISVVPGYI